MIKTSSHIVVGEGLLLPSNFKPKTPKGLADMSEDCNFRYGYYEKVGFGGIEEKKSLEILLREKPPDLLARLSQLTSRYSLSAIHRKQVWQLLLDVIRPDIRITETRIKIQRQISSDIINALELMMLIEPSIFKLENIDNSSNGHPKLIVMLFLFETKQLEINPMCQKQFEKVDVKDLLCISEVFTKEFLLQNTPHSLEDTYWIYKHFITLVQTNFAALLETYEKFVHNLANEDQMLHIHLVNNGIIKKTAQNNSGHTHLSNGSHGPSHSHNHHNLNSTSTIHFLQTEHLKLQQKYKLLSYRPMVTWFVRFFAGIIHQSFLIRVFDKLIGCLIHGPRPFYILISVGKALITHSREQLLLLSSCDDISKRLLSPLSIEESEQIVIKALSN